MENRTILFQGKEIDVDDEPGGWPDLVGLEQAEERRKLLFGGADQ